MARSIVLFPDPVEDCPSMHVGPQPSHRGIRRSHLPESWCYEPGQEKAREKAARDKAEEEGTGQQRGRGAPQ